MTSEIEKAKQAFAEVFNRKIGYQTGRPQEVLSDDFLRPFAERLNYMTKSGSGGSRETSKKTSSDEEAISDAQRAENIAAMGGDEEQDSGWFDGLGGFKMNALKLVSRPLDIVTRPAYAIAEASRNMQESVNAGEPFWSLGDDALWGAGQGAAGFKKTGWGQVVEEASKFDPDNTNWANALGDFLVPGNILYQMPLVYTQQHGTEDQKKWLKRGLGFMGDIAYDPTTYVSGGVIKAAKTGVEGAVEQGLKAQLKSSLKAGTRDQITGRTGFRNVVEREVGSAVSNSAAKNITYDVVEKGGTKRTVNAVDEAVANALDQVDRIVYDVKGGAQKGKSIFGEEASRTIAQTAAASHQGSRLRGLDQYVRKFMSADGKGKMTTKGLKSLKDESDVFSTWHDNYVELLSKGATKGAAAGAAKRAVAESLSKETEAIFSRVLQGISGSMANVPTLRMFGQDVAHFPKLGELVTAGGKRLGDSDFGRAMKAFSWTSKFPGYSSLIAQKARALGSKGFETFRRRVIAAAKDTTAEERKLLHKAIQQGTKTLNDPRLDEKLAVLKEFYKELHINEVAVGVRKNDPMDNYAYTYLRGKDSDVKDFLKKRKDAIKNKTFDPDIHGSQGAKKLGLKTEDDAFRNVLYRAMKSNRRQTRQYFFRDLASHYGVKGIFSESEAVKRGLVKVPADRIDDDIKNALKNGEKLYIDKDIDAIQTYYDELLKPGSAEAAGMTKALDYVTRQFKTLNTIYFPAFHIRNFISDMFMGALDGVSVGDYKKVFKGWKSYVLGKNLDTQIDVGGHTFKFEKMLDSFEENASSGGFFSADLTDKGLRAGSGIKGMTDPRTWPAGARKFSESREDFGRFSHFYHAMGEEYPAALKKYGGNVDKAWDAAVNSSVFRVNKYKFDYGALTKFEQKFMRRGIPFYTYARKAIPTLIESMFLSPRNLSYTNRFFDQFGDDLQDTLIPDWMREVGFAQLTGGEEPTGLSANFLPQNVFNDYATNLPATTNPLLRAGFELQSGKDTFSGRPVTGLEDLLYNNLRMSQYLPPAISPGDQTPKLWNPDVSPAERIGMVTGIPLYTATKERQDQELQDKVFDLKGNLQSINNSAHNSGYHIYFSDSKTGTKIKIRTYDPGDPDARGEVIGEFSTFDEATSALNRLMSRGN